jgi:hypothetical protein
MTYEQFAAFMQSVYVALPDVAVEVKFSTETTEGLKATHKTWFRVLNRFSVDECQAVLDSWLDGTEPLPTKKSDQRLIVFVIRKIILRRRGPGRKVDGSRHVAGESFIERRERMRQEYKPNALGLLDVREAFRAGLKAKQSIVDGSSEDEARERIKQVINAIG